MTELNLICPTCGAPARELKCRMCNKRIITTIVASCRLCGAIVCSDACCSLHQADDCGWVSFKGPRKDFRMFRCVQNDHLFAVPRELYKEWSKKYVGGCIECGGTVMRFIDFDAGEASKSMPYKVYEGEK